MAESGVEVATIADRQFFTVAELCDYLKISRSALYGLRYVHKAPPAIKIGKQLRFRRADVEQWLAEKEPA